MNRKARKKWKLIARGTYRRNCQRHIERLNRTYEAFIKSLEEAGGYIIDRDLAPYSLKAMLESEP